MLFTLFLKRNKHKIALSCQVFAEIDSTRYLISLTKITIDIYEFTIPYYSI